MSRPPDPLAPPSDAPVQRVLRAARVDLKALHTAIRVEAAAYTVNDPLGREFNRWCADVVERAERYNDKITPG